MFYRAFLFLIAVFERKEMQEELSEMKTDIALIKADIKQLNKFFTKVESSIDMMAELSKNVAVQQEILKNTIDKVDDLDIMITEHRKEEAARTKAMHQRLEDYRKSSFNDHDRLAKNNQASRDQRHAEIMEEIKELNTQMLAKLSAQEKRIQGLENWKYYMMGMGAVVAFVLAKIVNFGGFFG
jgi:hypothetical protein